MGIHTSPRVSPDFREQTLENIMHSKIGSGRKLAVAEAAAFIGVSKSWLDKKRVDGGGPAYLKIGRRVLYDLNDLEDFTASKRLRSTSDRSSTSERAA